MTASETASTQARGQRVVSPRQRDFEAEVVPHLRGLRRFAVRLARNADDADDLLQETLLRAWRGFEGYAAGTNVRAWLNKILYHVHVDALRRASRSPRTEPLSGQEVTIAPIQVDHGERERLERALGRLSAALRPALVLREVHERSYAEIAVALALPLGTVMSRIHRGRAALRRNLLALRQ